MSLVTESQKLFIRQRRELIEFFGFETRNKYEILNEREQVVGFAAEQQKGFFGIILRQLLGHWRVFTILIFKADRTQYLRAEHPWRIFFERLEIFEPDGKLIGAVQRRFSILTKRFDLEDASGQVFLEVKSPFWRIWTFPFERNGQVQAVVTKKWSGAISEIFTDRDNFMVEFQSPQLNETQRKLILAAGLFIDLLYFEAKASGGGGWFSAGD